MKIIVVLKSLLFILFLPIIIYYFFIIPITEEQIELRVTEELEKVRGKGRKLGGNQNNIRTIHNWQ
jgi:hypothetical protein